jgi:hypothetical protein
MALLFLESIGPEGERLALEAGRLTEIPVGFDSGLGSATFDSDELGEAELEGIVFDALAGIDPDWRDHLRPVD